MPTEFSERGRRLENAGFENWDGTFSLSEGCSFCVFLLEVVYFGLDVPLELTDELDFCI
jgi:hypothetical protein